MFVILFDPLRLPIVRFFDKTFGSSGSIRTRRSLHQTNLEQNVDEAFKMFTSALDRIVFIANNVKNM